MHRAGLASAGATALVTSMQTLRPIPSITSLPTLNLRGHHQTLHAAALFMKGFLMPIL